MSDLRTRVEDWIGRMRPIADAASRRHQVDVSVPLHNAIDALQEALDVAALGVPSSFVPLHPDTPTAESDSHTSRPAPEVNDESHPTADAAADTDELPLCGCDATGYRHHSACPVMAAHRAQVEAARRDALNQAADALEGRLGIEGTPRDLWEFRNWLRDRAAGGGA